MPQSSWMKHLLRPEVLLAEVFLLLALIVWAWGSGAVAALLTGPFAGPDRRYLVELATTLILLCLTALSGLACYAMYLGYLLTRRTQTIAEEMVSGLVVSREQFKLLYDNSSVPYFLMDDGGHIRNPNKACLRFFGGTTEECEAANFYERIDASVAVRQDVALVRTKVERGVPVSREEMRLTTLDGSVHRWAQVSIYSLARTSPLPLKHVVTLVDVTKEKESDEVKTDFFLLASHQLRTPMTTIKWYIDYLLHTESLHLSDLVRGYLEQIDIGNERMIELVTTLLTVSRIELGTLLPEYAPVHVNDVVNDILKELVHDLKSKDLRYQVVSQGDDKIITDHAMLRIVIHNLLTNALKYTPQGGAITITSDFGQVAATVAVHDTGCGIPLAEQEQIFTKLFRASNARKMSANGTGLGLYLTREFVKKLGGDVTFISSPGEGTTFTITLPRVAPGA